MREKGMGEEGQEELCSFLFGDFEKERLFPKPKEYFHAREAMKPSIVPALQNLLCCKTAFFPFTKEKQPVLGPVMTMAANNYWTPTKGQAGSVLGDLHVFI